MYRDKDQSDMKWISWYVEYETKEFRGLPRIKKSTEWISTCQLTTVYGGSCRYLASIDSTASMGSLPKLPPWRVPDDRPCQSRSRSRSRSPRSRSRSHSTSLNSRLSLNPLGGNNVISSTELHNESEKRALKRMERLLLMSNVEKYFYRHLIDWEINIFFEFFFSTN